MSSRLVGLATAALLLGSTTALVGCEGEKGPKGDTGVAGPQGPQGPTAVIPDAGVPDPGPGALASAHVAAHQAGTPHADRVIFFLGDGMGIPVVTAARIFARGEDGELTLDTLPETGFVRTYSRDSRVTDSAPSMSAYMTGVKMNNDVLSMSPETAFNGKGSAVPTFLEWAEAAGWSTGVVTTTRVTHATPAATYSHISNRDLEEAIAQQLVPGAPGSNSSLGDGLEVILGGGSKQFTTRADKRDLVAELKARGYGYVTQAAQLQDLPLSGEPKQKVLGLFTESHMSYELNRDPAREPSLAQMAVKAVQVLDQNPKGFFLMVEGGRIDHALHETTAKKALKDTVAFDEALAAVLAEVKKKDPTLAHTLVVLTSDHDHTLVHLGYAKRTGATTATNAGVLGLVRNYAGAAEGAPTLDADGQPYTILGFGNGERRVMGSRAFAPTLTEDLTAGDEYHQEAAIHMPTGAETHGGTDVTIRAVGFGSEQFHGFMTNTEVFGLLRNASKL
ncbi:alkaline phosphatase [Corallococcus sp. M34]|uniref:alkaline phosphatase n=1 Tax=Citreicoccus inhibens TaxID=2849499 RepID=UPI001C225D13|nr:alkaline phosphatase [Citreicoccus inhibens]MBU8894923.1 alkaline phosphatase [Citreicoccus inhibens]